MDTARGGFPKINYKFKIPFPMRHLHPILFVDGNVAFNKFAKNVIELDNLPLIAKCENNPLEALDYLRKCTPANFPAAIVAATRLPFCNGFEFINRCIQEFLDDYPETLFFLTSNSPNEKERALVSSHPLIVDMLEKPFTKQVYIKQLRPNLSPKTTTS